MGNKCIVAILLFLFVFTAIAISTPLPDPPQSSIAVDSSANQYSMGGTRHECLGYNPVIGGLGFVCRGFATSGILNVTETDSLFNFFIHDYSVYTQDYGGARYPSFTAGSDPYLFFPTTMGFMGGMYESGGWWSSYWDLPVSMSGNWYRIISKQLDDENILCILTDTNYIYYTTLTPDLGTVISSGFIGDGYYYWGFDINGGIMYMFYYDESLNVYHQTTTDGIGWSPQEPDSIIWPQPYPNSVICWMQMALTNGGNPILVFNVIDGDDPDWPYYGKIYVNVAPAETCIEVSSAFGMPDTECTYCTIATGGLGNDKVVVIYCTPRNNLPDSLCFWDIFYNYSTDNGITWNTPTNTTSNDPVNHCLPQLAKRLSSVAFYCAYGTCIEHNYYDLMWDYNQGGPQAPPTRWYLGYNPVPGVEEYHAERPQEMALSIKPNPFTRNLMVKFQIRNSPPPLPSPLEGEDKRGRDHSHISLKIFDAMGRLVKSFNLLTLQPLNQITWRGNDDVGRALPSGVYLVVLESGGQEVTEKAILLR